MINHGGYLLRLNREKWSAFIFFTWRPLRTPEVECPWGIWQLGLCSCTQLAAEVILTAHYITLSLTVKVIYDPAEAVLVE
jgi:hypothetical protein